MKVVAGGQDNISTVQNKYFSWAMDEKDSTVTAQAEHAYMPMLVTAEHVAKIHDISRESQNAYAKGANWNDTFWEHERFNKLLIEARAELDPNKRRVLYYEMQKITRDEGGVIIPMYASYVFAMTKKLAHGPMAANWDMDGNKASERWWFA